MKKLLVTGSSGLIGSEVCAYFARELRLHGARRRQQPARRVLRRRRATRAGTSSGSSASCRASRITSSTSAIAPACSRWWRGCGRGVIVHAAAQPSHDRAAAIPFDDFDTNAVGTLNLLEAARQAVPGVAVRPHVDEQGVRRRAEPDSADGARDALGLRRPGVRATAFPRPFTIDQSKHSLFGASKVAADVMVQEYGRYFDMPTCCLRGGCLTGPNHSGVELHGFLSLPGEVQSRRHARTRCSATRASRCATTSTRSTSRASSPRSSQAPRRGEVYNLGGGKRELLLDPRGVCDHRGHDRAGSRSTPTSTRTAPAITSATISDLRKMRAHYPRWDITKSLSRRCGRSSTRGSRLGRMPDGALPRLLYLADVPVEASYHGSALMYRLLQRYPADRLRVVEGNLFTRHRSPPARCAQPDAGSAGGGC